MPSDFCQSLIKADQRDPGRDDRYAVDYGYQPLTAMIFRFDELRFAARNSELLSRDVTNCPALADETEVALSWLENTVRIGNVNYPILV